MDLPVGYHITRPVITADMNYLRWQMDLTGSFRRYDTRNKAHILLSVEKFRRWVVLDVIQEPVTAEKVAASFMRDIAYI